MKLSIIILLFVSCFTYAQQNGASSTADPKSALSNETIEKSAEFPGGKSAFYKYISRNFQMPDVEGINGRIIVTFIIEKDGSVTEVKVLKDLGHGTSEEAIRILTNSPKWNPGEQNGQKVRVMYTIPISINTGS